MFIHQKKEARCAKPGLISSRPHTSCWVPRPSAQNHPASSLQHLQQPEKDPPEPRPGAQLWGQG